MEIRWLEDFLALARTQHFSRAAESRHVSQPTFSRRIRILEETMGTTLINRQTFPLSLTPAGEQFRDMCERMTRDLRQTRERIAAMEEAASRRISVGSTQGLFSHFFQKWADQSGLRERLAINLESTNWIGKDFLDALDTGDVDLVLCYWHEYLPWQQRLDPEHYTWLTLGRERITPFSIAQQDGSPRFALPGTVDQPVPTITYHSRGFLSSAILERLNQCPQQAHLFPLNENSHSASIKTLVKQGFGMGWLPYRMGETNLQYGQLARAGDSQWDVHVDIRLIRLRTPRSEDVLTLWNELEHQNDQ